MHEVHIYAFCQRLSREIVTIDVRQAMCKIMHFKPGYNSAKEISKTFAKKTLRKNANILWVLLKPDHFEALLPDAK